MGELGAAFDKPLTTSASGNSTSPAQEITGKVHRFLRSSEVTSTTLDRTEETAGDQNIRSRFDTSINSRLPKGVQAIKLTGVATRSQLIRSDITDTSQVTTTEISKSTTRNSASIAHHLESTHTIVSGFERLNNLCLRYSFNRSLTGTAL